MKTTKSKRPISYNGPDVLAYDASPGAQDLRAMLPLEDAAAPPELVSGEEPVAEQVSLPNGDDAAGEAPDEPRGWDPVPGSVGRQEPETANEDEDEEGRSETEQLAEQGVEKAERERMQQAAQLAKHGNSSSQ